MEIAYQIFWLLILSMVVASISWTVTQEEIFREWRDVCEDKSKTCRSIPQRKFFYVFTCEYCFSHWASLAVVALANFRLLIDDSRGYILAFFVLSWLANQWMSLYRRLQVVIEHENELAEQVKAENEDMS